MTESDGGRYWCRASNFVGRSENSFWLRVQRPGNQEVETPPPASRPPPLGGGANGGGFVGLCLLKNGTHKTTDVLEALLSLMPS